MVYKSGGMKIIQEEFEKIFSLSFKHYASATVAELKTGNRKVRNSFDLNLKVFDLFGLGNETKFIENVSLLFDLVAAVTSANEDNQKTFIRSEELSYVFEFLIFEKELKLQRSAAKLLVSLSRCSYHSRKELYNYSLFKLIFRLMVVKDEELQLHLSSILCNLLQQYKTEKAALAEILESLKEIFKSTKYLAIRGNCLFALKNIIYSYSTSSEIKDLVLKYFPAEELVNLLGTDDEQMKEQLLLCFRYLIYKMRTLDILGLSDIFEKEFAAKMCQILKENQTYSVQVMFIVWSIAQGTENGKKYLIHNGVLDCLTQMLVVN